MEDIMLQIGENTLVSLDIAEKFFCCDLAICKGQCCVEGDAGAPITDEERQEIENEWQKAESFMTKEGINEVRKRGVSYIDEEGDLVTTIVNGRDCAFTCHAVDGLCLCSLEKANREGLSNFIKPISCSLYPLRITQYTDFVAVNYHKWKICEPAVKLGEKLGIRLYEFLKEPLIRRFGKEWYDELEMTCKIYLEENNPK